MTSGISPENEKSNYTAILYYFELLNTNYVKALGAFERQFIAETGEDKKYKKAYAFLKYLLTEVKFSKCDASTKELIWC